MSGQRTPSSPLISTPSPTTSRPGNDPASSHRPRKKNQAPSGSPQIQQSPTPILVENFNPNTPVQSVFPTTRPLAHREDSRRSHRKSTKTAISTSTSPETAPPEREHKSRPSPPRSQSSRNGQIPPPPNVTSSSHGEPTKTPLLSAARTIPQKDAVPPSNTALVGAYLLTHPLAQLSLLLDLALSNSPNTNQAPAHFLRSHIASAISGITYLLSEIQNLNVETACSLLPAQPKTEQEWLDVEWALFRKIEMGVDEGSWVLRVAGEVVKVDGENRWRSWWYWGQIRRVEKRREWEEKGKAREVERGSTDKRREDRGAGNAGDSMEGLALDMEGTKLPGIKKFWREMSNEEKGAAEREFYEVLRRELTALPQMRDGGEAIMVRESLGMRDMKSAIETAEEVRAREDREAERRQEKGEEKAGSRRKADIGGTTAKDSVERSKELSMRAGNPTATQATRAPIGGQLGESSLTDRSRVHPRRSKTEQPTSSLERSGRESRAVAARG